MIRLLADCGNTCIKLARADGRQVVDWERLEPGSERLHDWLEGHPDAAELVVLPGSRTQAAHLSGAWVQRSHGRPWREVGRDLRLPDLGQYPGCGADRVLAGLVAGGEGDALVVDCGTATTITAWFLGDRCAQFGGGVILPGARACLAGLHALAPALPLVEPGAPDARADQTSTAGALAAGIGIGYGALVRACLERLGRDTGIGRIRWTGGAAAPLQAAGVLPADGHRPALVLEGLAQLAESGRR